MTYLALLDRFFSNNSSSSKAKEAQKKRKKRNRVCRIEELEGREMLSAISPLEFALEKELAAVTAFVDVQYPRDVAVDSQEITLPLQMGSSSFVTTPHVLDRSEGRVTVGWSGSAPAGGGFTVVYRFNTGFGGQQNVSANTFTFTLSGFSENTSTPISIYVYARNSGGQNVSGNGR